MDDRETQSNPPHMEQKQLFEKVKERISISKYIDFLLIIKHVLEEEEQHNKENKKTSSKAMFDRYVTRLVRIHYSVSETERRSASQSILEELKSTNLRSKFLSEQIKYIEDAQLEGSYIDTNNLDDGSLPPTFGGMNAADREALNHRYILPDTVLRSDNVKVRQTKEYTANVTNDQKLQDAEDDRYDMEMQLVRNEALQFKLKFVIDQQYVRHRIRKCERDKISLLIQTSSIIPHLPYSSEESSYYHALNQELVQKQAPRKNPKRNASVEFPDIEFAALVDIYGFGNRGGQVNGSAIEERKHVAMEIQESLRARPVRTAKALLSLVKKRHESLRYRKQYVFEEYMSTMENRFLDSIWRNSEGIKQNDYPFFSIENLLKDIISPASGRDPPKNSFVTKSDDVSTQLWQENGLLMQFETTRWHKDALDLLQSGGSVAQREKLPKFLWLVKTFFDLNTGEGGCLRADEGDFAGMMLYGSERLYAAIRLYHILLVRLYSAYLQAEVDAAEHRFRTHCDDVGKARLKAANPLAYLPLATRHAAGWKQLALPPTEGTAEEKMNRFLQTVKKRETNSRGNTYPVCNFERDILWAIGANGNKFFTMTRILTRIREAVREVEDSCFELFEKYCEQLRNGVPCAAKKYEEEINGSEKGWLFKFQFSYSDRFIDDDWGSVGERGEVGRLQAMIMKRGTLPGEANGENGKRSTTSHRGKPGKKRKTAKLDWLR